MVARSLFTAAVNMAQGLRLQGAGGDPGGPPRRTCLPAIERCRNGSNRVLPHVGSRPWGSSTTGTMGVWRLSFRRTALLLLLLVALYLAGATAFMVVEGRTFLDSLYYMTVTLTTIGYGDIVPGSTAGKLLVVVLGPLSLVLVFGLGVGLVAGRVEAVLEGAWRRVERQIRTLEDHVIVCGHGRLGTVVTETLRDMGEKVVLIERDEEKARALAEAGALVVHGDAQEEDVLRRAGIDRARVVIATLGDDKVNVYIALAVRDVRPQVEVVSAAFTREAVRHLHRAGAKRVISPTLVAGEMLARCVVESGSAGN